jgi:hypothetical protein
VIILKHCIISAFICFPARFSSPKHFRKEEEKTEKKKKKADGKEALAIHQKETE